MIAFEHQHRTKRTSCNGALSKAHCCARGALPSLDRENLAEEIESLGRGDRREIRSRTEVLIAHLLKWEFQPAHRCHGWQASITEQRIWIGNIIKDSPSLRRYPSQVFDEAYRDALPVAVRETGLRKPHLPSEPPFTAKQALDGDFARTARFQWTAFCEIKLAAFAC
ncbi:DUF29 domain-containing protein [Mesorhizobium sp. LNHC209A00]|uniref:DUF29 domain-containing protein n=1 Tax=Mesorhizobium TaxID=68287 RepID=UPI0032AF8227